MSTTHNDTLYLLADLFTGRRTPLEQLLSQKTRNSSLLRIRILHSIENKIPLTSSDYRPIGFHKILLVARGAASCVSARLATNVDLFACFAERKSS